VNWLRRFWPGRRRELRHVRLHILHEGSQTGDVTLEGFETSERRDWIVLERATLIEHDGSRRRLQGPIDVPRRRVVLREHLVAVALPELPEFVGDSA